MNSKLMPEWNISPETIKYRQHGESVVFQNMLYVPLEELIALPDVTVTIGKKFPSVEQALKTVEEKYKPNKSTLYETRANYIRSIQTSTEERTMRQSIAADIRELTTQKEALSFLTDGWSFDEIKEIMPELF